MYELWKENAEQLKERISLAFADTKYPSQEAERDNYIGGDNERREVADYYQNKRWSEMKFEDDINEHNRDPGALYSDYFSYYLPLLLLNGLEAVMEDAHHADTFISYLVARITHHFQIKPGEIQTIDLDKNQCRAVLEWLDLIALIYGVSSNIVPVTLRNFWRILLHKITYPGQIL